MNSRELIFKDTGETLLRTITEELVDIPDSEIAKLAQTTEKRINNVGEVDGYQYDVIVASDGIYTSGWLKSLSIRAPYSADSNGVLHPNLSSKTEPVLTMEWAPPRDAALHLICKSCNASDSGLGVNHSIMAMWLFLIDRDGVGFRLPIGNIHDDCAICMGNGNGVGSDFLNEAVQRTMERFRQTQWNADLWKDISSTQLMFGWKPVDSKNGEFQQQPIPDNWKNLCIKVATAMMSKIRMA